MRSYFIGFLIFLAGCKAVTTTGSDEPAQPYSEDLSSYIDAFEPKNFQENSRESNGASFEMEANEEIDSVMKIFTEKNRSKKYWDGFIIQIYTGSSRSEAELQLSKFKTQFPELPCYLQYYQPLYKVKAGQFFDRLEATRTLEEIKKSFPRSLMLPEKLPLPNARAN